MERQLFRGTLIVFWWLYWLLYVGTHLVGTVFTGFSSSQRLSEMVAFFATVGIQAPFVPYSFLILVSLVELTAFMFLSRALWHYYKVENSKVHAYFFRGILISLVLMTLATGADQLLGNDPMLLQHSVQWTAVLITWFLFTQSEEH